jgi:hypothetical protein
MKKAFIGFSIGVTAVSLIIIIILATGFWKNIFYPKTDDHLETRVVTPREVSSYALSGQAGQTTWDESLNTKIPMNDGETVIALLNIESEDGLMEDQFAVYHIPANADRTVYITHFDYDQTSAQYRRAWNSTTVATRPETISLFSQDIIGDRNNCIIITGMNNNNEHTMTIFRRVTSRTGSQSFNKIFELQIDGSIIIQEAVRSMAYQQGITAGQSFNIAAYGQDRTSTNIMDQIETIYTYNHAGGQYERTNVSRIPGAQIEQRRLRELLSGTPGVFENFIHDLWYYVSPQGTIDARQYLYFDPGAKEIIFFGDEAQQIFNWGSSTNTRYGMYIRSQNISISTLLRFIDIELVSLDSIRIRVTEDVRLRIAASTTWDGQYRKAGTASMEEAVSTIKPNIDALFDSSWGRVQFFRNGDYTINPGGTAVNSSVRKGRYVFYVVDGLDILEFRPENTSDSLTGGRDRMVYRITPTGNAAINLSRIRLGTSGIQDLFETIITLTPVEN